ncbi:MAG: class I SAM-dependent methyltransferase [Terriglobia bacterium]|jgi:SAM-dependent methyltransferase
MQISERVKNAIDICTSNREDTERLVEIPFLFDSLPEPSINIRTLDIGCCESPIVTELDKLGFNSWGIDLRDYIEGYPKFIKCDARNLKMIPDNSFDVAIAISTVEHIGLIDTPYHTDINLDDNGDKKSISEMVRAIKPGGIIILTIPYGKGDNTLTSWIRFYNKERVNNIIPTNIIIDKKIYRQRTIDNDIIKWIDVSEDIASQGYSYAPAIANVLCISGHKCNV